MADKVKRWKEEWGMSDDRQSIEVVAASDYDAALSTVKKLNKQIQDLEIAFRDLSERYNKNSLRIDQALAKLTNGR